MWVLALASFTSMILVVTLKILMSSRNLTYMNIIAIFPASILVYIIYMWVSNTLGNTNMENVVMMAHRCPLFYLCIICSVGACMIVDASVESYIFVFKPTPSQFLRTLVN